VLLGPLCKLFYASLHAYTNLRIGVNAFDYMVLARMIWFFIPAKSLWGIKPAMLAIVFVTLDITSFVIQLVGGGMAGPGQSQEKVMNGIHIYMGGIGLQEAFIVIFFGLTIAFHLEMLKIERTGLLNSTPKAKWRWMVFALYASLTFITIRIIFRLAEFSNGNDMSNPLPYHEVYAYVFDALPIFFAILVWNIVHPGRIFKGPGSVMPSGQLRNMLCCCCPTRSKPCHNGCKSRSDSDDDCVLLSERTDAATLGSNGANNGVSRYDMRTGQMPSYAYDGVRGGARA
jgi:hypothetical protein